MTYEELKKIAQPHIRENDNLPSNSFLLLNQLHIQYKTEYQCSEDFKGKYNPMHDHPAFLYVTNNDKILYFKTTSRYWNFYVFHEIAHYLLGHEDNSPQNELDANLLACILVAPIENFPTTIKTAQDLSSTCQIPVDRAEEYWQEIKNKTPYRQKLKKRITLLAVCLIVMLTVFTTYITLKNNNTKPSGNSNFQTSTETPSLSENLIRPPLKENQVIVTISGTKYHMPDCRYVKNKTNVIEEDINTAINDGYAPCKVCIK